jgi:glutaconate CoA-transferase subunit A
MAAAYAAGASNLPFGLVRGYEGTDLSARTRVAWITSPFDGEQVAAVPAIRPDVGIVHAQQADEAGNVQLWGISGIQKEVVLASRHSIVTVEEVVPRFEPRPNAVFLPGWAITAVAVAPGGAHPSYALGYYKRDNGFYVRWDEISRDRDRFQEWMRRYVFEREPSVV